MPLDADDAGGQSGQHRGLITAARADFEHFFPARQGEGFGHQGDDVGLADRLAAIDRQGPIGVGLGPQLVGKKHLAWDGSHGRQHARVDNAAADELLLDHSTALLGIRRKSGHDEPPLTPDRPGGARPGGNPARRDLWHSTQWGHRGLPPGGLRAYPRTAGDCPRFCAVRGAKWDCPLLRGGSRIGSREAGRWAKNRPWRGAPPRNRRVPAVSRAANRRVATRRCGGREIR